MTAELKQLKSPVAERQTQVRELLEEALAAGYEFVALVVIKADDTVVTRCSRPDSAVKAIGALEAAKLDFWHGWQ